MSKAKIIALLNRSLRPLDVKVLRRSELWRPLSLLNRQPPPNPVASSALPEPFCLAYKGARVGSLQTPFDFAVVMPTTMRATIVDAIRSIFAQDLPGRVQILVGVDRPAGDCATLLDPVCRDLPDNQAISVFYPGYSTSRRHGGLHHAWDGGVLRTVLTYLANSRHVAYLDDDNWWAPHHLRTLRDALQGHDWAYARRWFVHPGSRRPICEDAWESVGPDNGYFATTFGGWVDPNCLAIDKFACEAVVRWWSIPLRNTTKAMDADRNVFGILKDEFKGRTTDEATVYYMLDERDRQHAFRIRMIGAERYASYEAATP